MTRSPMRARSRVTQVIAGLCSAVLLVVLVAAIPFALLRLGTGLLPHHVPTLSAVRDALLHKDVSGTLFMQVLVVVGWLAWLSFAVSVLIELVARIRGRSTVSLPGLRAQQRWAAALIAAITLMFASPAIASASSLPQMTRPTAIVSTVTPTITRTVTALPPSAAPGAAVETTANAPVGSHGALTYEVKRGDYLGTIAQRFEGQFNDYHAIARANHIDDPAHIEPGWTLTLPSDATDRGAMPHARGHVTGATPASPTGKTPSGPQTSPSAPPSGGTAPGPTSAPTAPTGPSQPTVTGAPTPANTASAHPTPSHPAPSHPASAHPAPSHPAPSHPASTHSAPAAAGTGTGSGAAGSGSGAGSVVVEMLEASGTLAAVVSLSLIAVSRREQLQRRLVKHVPAAATGGAMPRLMAPTQQRDLIRVDASLRSLAAMVDGWPIERIPQIAGVWTDHGAITLMLADDCGAAPRPFTDDANGWLLDPSGEFIVHPEQVAPLPTLVTVGGRANQHLLLDIEYLRVLGIGGHPVESMNLLRFIAVELSHNVWSDDVRVVLAGFEDEAGALAAIDPDRVRVQPSIAEAVVRFRSRLARAVANWDAPPGPPEILLVASPSVDVCDDLAALERDLMRAPGVGMAVVIAAMPDEFEASRYQVRVTSDGLLRVGFLGDAVMPAASLPAMLLPEVGSLIGSARREGDTSPIDLARAASRAALRMASEATAPAGRTTVSTRRTGTMAGAHRRPPGEKPAPREGLVDLTKARHVRTA